MWSPLSTRIPKFDKTLNLMQTNFKYYHICEYLFLSHVFLMIFISSSYYFMEYTLTVKRGSWQGHLC